LLDRNFTSRRTAVNEDTDIEYVGFWARVGAAIIDTILLLVVSIPLLRLVYALSDWEQQVHTADRVEFAISYVLPVVLVIALWVWLSSTPGKMLIGAVIVDARSGGKPSVLQFVIRYLGYYVSLVPLGLGLIWVGIDPRKQGWHDKMARTVVIRKKAVMRH
jgi:uncharacterized RDD family membrane protein YckC